MKSQSDIRKEREGEWKIIVVSSKEHSEGGVRSRGQLASAFLRETESLCFEQVIWVCLVF